MVRSSDIPDIGGPSLVDLHAHILPGLDDGPRDDREVLTMLEAAVADGIGTIVATPHAHHTSSGDILAGVEWLNRLVREADLQITVLPGCEARIHPDLVERYRAGELLTINGTDWLLLELYLHDEWPTHLVERAVGRLLDAGLRPVLAHAERYPFVQRDPSALAPLVERGIPVQINARSLFYREGDVERVTAEALLRSRLAHIIASDAHNARYRPPVIRMGLERAVSVTEPRYVAAMVDIAASIARGDFVGLPAASEG